MFKLDADFKTIAKDSYNKIKPYLAHTPADPRDVLIEQSQQWATVWCPSALEGIIFKFPAGKFSKAN